MAEGLTRYDLAIVVVYENHVLNWDYNIPHGCVEQNIVAAGPQADRVHLRSENRRRFTLNPVYGLKCSNSEILLFNLQSKLFN